MARKPVIVFLIKVVPLFAVFLFLWHSRGLAGWYYRLVASVLDAVYPGLDPAGVVTGVAVKGNEFGVGFVAAAKRQVLSLNAADITSNVAMLFSLFLASPILRRTRVFLTHVAISVVVLFVIHVFTAMTLIQRAFMTHPAVMAGSPFSKTEIKFTLLYTSFYEEMGMYLLVLVLWFPYILWCLRGAAKESDPPEDAGAEPSDP